MDSEPPRATVPDEPAGLPAPVRVLLLVFAVPLVIVGLLLLVAAVRDISAAPMAVLVIAVAQIIAGGAMAAAAARGRSRFWGGESVSSILLPLVGALALVTAYDRSGQAARALGISEPAAAALFLIIAGVAIFAAIVLAWRRGVRERQTGPGSGDAR
jgi:ABC-type uncharacterized transport system permease subunit